jgi:Mn-dependent DtxR family transcriptional regulator
MGQYSIYDLLQREGRWMKSKDIAKFMNINLTSVNVALHKLYKSGFIVVKKIKRRNKSGYCRTNIFYYKVKK